MVRNRAKSLMIVTLLFAAAGLTACSDSREDKRLRGQVIGGATGAAVGSLFGKGGGQVVAVGAGAVLGTVIGGKVADSNSK